MASKSDSVWAIDIGSNSLKALRLSDVDGVLEVTGFDNIRYSKNLSGGGIKPAERDELIALALHDFVSRNNLGKDVVVVSVPSQSSFARFVKLPPVEEKRIPEIVKFEAAQQIPFDINDVQWDWQLMSDSSEAETKVGIFAIKNEIVNSALEHFSRENIQVSYVQMSPMALYNYLLYDRPKMCSSDTQATVILNIGAENTDLVVCTRSAVWQRCIPMGGNTFTKAISDTFKLNFEKAEKLKRTAAMSKYARQILQAMKPVFTDLASEIQRSLGFYSSSNPNTKLAKVVAMGGGTKMRGLLKYLQQSLQIPIERPDAFKKLTLSSEISTAKFHENVTDFGVVYGLALQGMGLSRIESNLLPRRIARSMAWAGKAKYFIAAASILLFVSSLCLARTYLDSVKYTGKKPEREKISMVNNAADTAIKKLKTQKAKEPEYQAIIQKELDIFNYRDLIPKLHEIIISALPNEKNNSRQAELYKCFVENDIRSILKTERKKRKQIFITSMSISFADNIARADFSDVGMLKGKTKATKKGGKKGDGDSIENYMMEMMGGLQTETKYKAKSYGKGGGQKREEEELEQGPGFVVTISGSSPYKELVKLIDPIGVENDEEKWGVVTRLMHLNDANDSNCPFKLYDKTKIEHFKLETGPVDLMQAMPAGIGIEDDSEETIENLNGMAVLIDPMTKEIISRVPELDESGKVKLDRKGKEIYRDNDYWFILNAKFIWKDAPESAKGKGSAKY